MRSIALDIHRDFCEVAIKEGGEVRSRGRIKTGVEELEPSARTADDARPVTPGLDTARSFMDDFHPSRSPAASKASSGVRYICTRRISPPSSV